MQKSTRTTRMAPPTGNVSAPTGGEQNVAASPGSDCLTRNPKRRDNESTFVQVEIPEEESQQQQEIAKRLGINIVSIEEANGMARIIYCVPPDVSLAPQAGLSTND